jgi:ribosomal protein L24E
VGFSNPMNRATRRVLLAGVAAVTGLLPLSSLGVADAAPRARVSAALTITQIWSHALPDNGAPVGLSSPNVANLDGRPAVVVGDHKGFVYAYHLADGSGVGGWPFNAGAPVDSTPSVAAINAGGTDSVFIGTGAPDHPNLGGYRAIRPTGANQWLVPATAPGGADPHGVRSSLAVGNLQGGTNVISGSMGQWQSAFNAVNGATLPGFPWFQADSNFTTPALADVFNNGQTEIIEGGDSTAGLAYSYQYQNGGHLRVLSRTGNLGQPQANGGLVCQYNTDQVVQSSPAVGQFTGTATMGAVFGTGTFWPGRSMTNHLLAVNLANCSLLWNVGLDGNTASSPALADVVGNRQLQVIEGTDNGSGGAVWALNGANGSTIWHRAAPGRVIGSVVTADLRNVGHQDVLVPTTAGVYILDGKTGTNLGALPNTNFEAFQNSALVTRDPNGTIGITVAGYNSGNQGVIQHYEVSGSNGSGVGGIGWWPMFHHDSHLTGFAPSPPPIIGMAAKPDGSAYWLGANNGGVYACGPTACGGAVGAMHLNRPIVGIAPTPTGRGYWRVATDGGIFAAGDARFWGSTGAIHLNRPIVGMAPTPNGGGYWLVASDGGIFAFGNAHFYGSTGAIHLNRPIVGMAAMPNGGGYWLVASDGGIFAFGSAKFHGSTGGIRLTRPIVGMSRTPTGAGYWLVASDGGIFAFGNAHFYGSTGAIRLNRPIVGMAATPTGGGYWFVASDGGVFAFGNAKFHGSLG